MKFAAPYRWIELDGEPAYCRPATNNGHITYIYAIIPRHINDQIKWEVDHGWYADTQKEAMEDMDEILTERGYTFVSQEQFDKYLVLL